MVTAARQLFRERGYHATALSDVWELSGAPRGSFTGRAIRSSSPFDAVLAALKSRAAQFDLAG